jgi:hypothetical protein
MRPRYVDQGGLEQHIRLEAKVPATPGVYSFVVNDVVVYVRLTPNSLGTCFDQCRYCHEGQKTSARINDRIAATLQAGKPVEVLIATPGEAEDQPHKA